MVNLPPRVMMLMPIVLHRMATILGRAILKKQAAGPAPCAKTAVGTYHAPCLLLVLIVINLQAMKEGLDSALTQRRASFVDDAQHERVQPPNLDAELERVRTAIEEENTNSGANSEYTCSVP